MSRSSASDPYPPATSSPPAALDDTSSRGTGSHNRSREVGCAGEGALSGNGATDGTQDGTQDGATDDAQDDAQDSTPDKTGDGAAKFMQDGAADNTLGEAWDRAKPNNADVEHNVDRPWEDVKQYWVSKV